MSSSNKIILKSSDGDYFQVDDAVALQSQTIRHMIEDNCAHNGIPLPNVNSKILAKVIQYCRKHVDASSADPLPSEDDLKTWDRDFVNVDQATLFDLILVLSFFFTPQIQLLSTLVSKGKFYWKLFCILKLSVFDQWVWCLPQINEILFFV